MAPKRPRRGRPPAKPDRTATTVSNKDADTGGDTSDRLTYRELRNTPGRVWERLATGGPLTLVADGEAKAIVIPIRGDPARAIEAYTRSRALMAIWKLQADSRAKGTDKMTLDEINAEIRAVRREHRQRVEGRTPTR